MQSVAEASFRRESARMLASLTRTFGPNRLSLAEDVVQETFARALVQWQIKGVPPNPAAWLHRVARNLAVDVLRRERIYADESALEALQVVQPEDDLLDDELRMLLLCCHPKLSTESQIALTLKAACGFGIGEISKALLCGAEAIERRLARSKRALAGIAFDLPTGPEADRRVSVVLHTLYLMFNEGYTRHSGPDLTDSELCDEAIMLASRLSKTPLGDRPDTHALLALMLFHSSRLPARNNSDGSLCLLEDQDRTKWDRSRIGAGLQQLSLAASGSTLTPYHCEAGIAACHAISPSFEESDWQSILASYNDLIALNASAIALLNRAVAVSMAVGPADGLLELDALRGHPKLQGYYLFHATRARILERLGRFEEATEEYRVAIGMAKNGSERQFLENRLHRLVDA